MKPEKADKPLVITNQGLTPVEVIFRIGGIITHRSVGGIGYSVSLEFCGYAFRPGTFHTSGGAEKFAHMSAGLRRLASSTQTKLVIFHLPFAAAFGDTGSRSVKGKSKRLAYNPDRHGYAGEQKKT